jgi:alpha-amylase/alpha-mannosidase (GH57 family)
MSNRYLCIHGHFYQPPRENAWTGFIEAQPSASPYRDWNERITKECYTPNTMARILVDGGRIGRMLNNYEYMSFNFGPTLLSWLEVNAPETYNLIIEADEKSRERNNGHGNALAQVYNHIIMPLANERDRLTQIRWGLKDFEKRFGRPAEGMWLAETAVDTETLRLMAQEGVRFTILSPGQAGAVRPLGSTDDKWKDVGNGSVDPRRPYRVVFDSKKTTHIDVFFYDGPVSRSIAYERLLESGAGFLSRIEQAYGKETEWPRLVNLATDGESYGHHFRFGEMALAWVFDKIEKDGSITPINYAAFLEKFPPRHEVRILENTSWSCAHGVERWRSDCGCHTAGGPEWNQKWRAPLRQGLDWLRDQMSTVFEKQGNELFKDPWAARDDYVDVLLNPDDETRRAFLAKHQKKTLKDQQVTDALRLLESQLMSLYMFTSCGWFFDDIAGLEAVQDLQYAARGIELIAPWAGQDLEAGLLDYLSRARPNHKVYTNGADVYRRKVLPNRVSPERAAAHCILGILVDEKHIDECPVARRAKISGRRKLTEAGLTAFMGEVQTRDQRTGQSWQGSFLAMDAGGADLECLIGQAGAIDTEGAGRIVTPMLEEAAKNRILDVFAEMIPNGERFDLSDLMLDTRNRLVRVRADDFFTRLRRWVLENYAPNRDVLMLLREGGPPPFAMEQFIFLTVLGERLNALLAEARTEGLLDLEALRALAAQARAWGVVAADPVMDEIVGGFLKERFELLENAPSELLLEELIGFLRLIQENEQRIDIWESQNSWFDLAHDSAFQKKIQPELTKPFSELGRVLGFFVADGDEVING